MRPVVAHKSVSKRKTLHGQIQRICSGVHNTRFHPDYGKIPSLNKTSLTQIHGGFTKVKTRSATAQKWYSPFMSTEILPATIFPLS